jgi:hypothetical protein
MSTRTSRISVSIAQTSEELKEALDFAGSVYERNYNTHWTVPPDLFFVAKENGEIMATGGLTFASLHPTISSERYFKLTDRMRRFIRANRERIVEFGRFASVRTISAKAILSTAVAYCALAEIDFIFSWATPHVSKYTCSQLGLNVWPIAVPLDLDSALRDPGWSSPPTGFFQQKHPPMLHLGVVPFWENAARMLAHECGNGAVPAWEATMPNEVVTVDRKAASLKRFLPRLIRSDRDVAALGRNARSAPPIPNIASVRQAAAMLLRTQAKPE